MTVQFFVDESERGGFCFAVVEVPARQVKERRRWLRCQLLRGQQRIRFTDERRQRRQGLMAWIAVWNPPPRVHIMRAAHRYQCEARQQCRVALSRLARQAGANLVVLERDDSRYKSDRRTLTVVNLTDRDDPVRWEIMRAKDDPPVLERGCDGVVL